ncbi:MAG TPA: hypothetical protein VMX55_14545 [candidate division Zixibacteria bacterium]|nr:hypothetical protein [candidate division Zixibacteria bacterium]
MESNRKRRMILYSFLVIFTIAIVVTSIEVPFLVMKNNLQEREFIIESVECTDMLGRNKDYTLKVRSQGQQFSSKYPIKIEPHKYEIYLDNQTSYKCYGKVIGDKFEVTLIVKLSGVKTQIIKRTFLIPSVIQKWTSLFAYGKLGGKLEMTFILLPISN